MLKKASDPTEPIRLKASAYPEVDKGTACTQTSFKARGKGFLYIGEQGGRYKAMFKLKDSIDEAKKLAAKSPEDYQVGAGGYVTARFSADKPMPKKLWVKWLDESYSLSITGGVPNRKKTARKKTTQKSTTTTKRKKKRTGN